MGTGDYKKLAPKQHFSGIYKIVNITNGKIYVGQSENVFVRWKQHFSALSKHQHENKDMQKDWNSGDKFKWFLIEWCEVSKLNEREKYWIDQLNTIERGYNKGWVPYRRKPQSKQIKVKGYHKTR